MSDEVPQRPTSNDDRDGWKAYWKTQGMSWRYEVSQSVAARDGVRIRPGHIHTGRLGNGCVVLGVGCDGGGRRHNSGWAE